jgi:hypothetical protein
LAPAPFKTSAVVFTALAAFTCATFVLAVPYSLSCLAAALGKASNIRTRTHGDDNMACTLHTPADKTSGSTLRKRKRVDNTDASGSRMRTHKADNRAAGDTLRTHNHSMADGTWRNRKRRSHRNYKPAHNRKRRKPKPAWPQMRDPRLRPPSRHTS